MPPKNVKQAPPGDKPPTEPIPKPVKGNPAVGTKAWAALAAAAPVGSTTRTPANKSQQARPANIPLGRNLTNQGGTAAGMNSRTASEGFNNAELAERFLRQRGITSIQCHICKKQREVDKFSHRQLISYKNSIHNEYAPTGRCKAATASCKDCVNVVVTELHCIGCGATKPLQKFMKTQRRNPDKARCKRCVQHDMETERLCETGDLDDYESDDSDDSAVDVDAPVGMQRHASDTAPGDDGLSNALGKLRVNELSLPSPAAPSSGNKLFDTGNALSASAAGDTTPGSTVDGRSSPDGSVGKSSISSNDWQPINVAKRNAVYAYSGYTTPSRSVSTAVSGAGTVAHTLVPGTGRKKGGWGAKAKAPTAEELAQNQMLWSSSATSINNGWSIHGGQPRIFKKKKKANDDSDDDEGYDYDGEE